MFKEWWLQILARKTAILTPFVFYLRQKSSRSNSTSNYDTIIPSTSLQINYSSSCHPMLHKPNRAIKSVLREPIIKNK